MQVDFSFFRTRLAPGAPTVLVYAPAAQPRLQFTCEFVFGTVLACNYSLTANTEAYKQHPGPKINYSARELPGLGIIPNGLLEETGLREEKPTLVFGEGEPVFFATQATNGQYKHDLFAAVFYFVSRYEEWQAFKADNHARFEAPESLLYQNTLHLRPLVDAWIRELGRTLEKMNPGFRVPAPEFRVLSTIDVDNLFAYKAKGWLRTGGAAARDLLTLRLKNFATRLLVLLGIKNDPFDIYSEALQFAKAHNFPLAFFFLCRSGTTYDRVATPGSAAFTRVVQELKGNALLGLHPSYGAFASQELLNAEHALLERMAGGPVSASRQHFLRYNIRQTPHLLRKAGIGMDFTMGFASSPGFRAGTAYPFYHFDFESNAPLPLLHVPFCAMDGAYLLYDTASATQALDSMLGLAEKVKQTGGFFITVFHESTLSDHLYKGFGDLYKKLHVRLKALSHPSN